MVANVINDVMATCSLLELMRQCIRAVIIIFKAAVIHESTFLKIVVVV